MKPGIAAIAFGARTTSGVRSIATAADGGLSSAGAQHCTPQPDAQAQPVVEWTGLGTAGLALLSAISEQSGLASELPAATASGNSTSCSATT